MTYTLDEIKALPELHLLPYIKIVEPLGQEIQDKYGIVKLVPMIQSAHESRNGNSGLARNHCNLFGIVATDSWKKSGNAVASMPTWEVIGGKQVDMDREFRSYKSWRDSFFDWARIITTLKVYKKAWDFIKNPETIPDGINSMALVYATDPSYARKLLDLYAQVKPV